MPTFHYQADDREGRRTSGEVAADDREQALLRLSESGLRSIKFSDLSVEASASAGAAKPAAPSTLSKDETVDLGALVGLLANANLPLDAGLSAAAQELPPGRLSRTLAAVSSALKRGQPLHEALDSEGKRFPLHLRGLVLAGLHSGRLGMALEEFVDLERRAAALRRQAALCLAYPTFLLVLLLGVGVFFLLAVFPGLAEIFEDFQPDMPPQTVALMKMSKEGLHVPVAILSTLLAIWLFVWLSTDLAEKRKLLKATPLIGPIARWASLARFSRLLALLVENRLELSEALRLAGAGCRDNELLAACREAARKVEAGCNLRDAFEQSPAFAKGLGPIVEWGQRAAALPEALRTASEMFESRAQSQLVFLRIIFPAFVMLFVMWGALFLISAITLPMFDLLGRLWWW